MGIAFNDYFHSEEAAIVWPVTRRAYRVGCHPGWSSPEESLAGALAAAVAGMYEPGEVSGLPPGRLMEFQVLAGAKPARHGEYLKASTSVEHILVGAIADRIGFDPDRLELQPLSPTRRRRESHTRPG